MERIGCNRISYSIETYINSALIYTEIHHWDTQTDCICGSIVLTRTNTVSELFTKREKMG